LEALALADIREKAWAACHNERRLAERILRLKNEESGNRLAGYERELRHLRARLPEIEALMQNLYEDRIRGTVPEPVFATLMQKYEAEREEKARAIPALEEKVRAGRENIEGVSQWMRHIRQYTWLEALNEGILIELVERIEVGAA
jgi:hypothetical protein